MNYFIVFSIIAFILPVIILHYVHITSIGDLALDTNSQIYAGEGEVCITPYTKINCQEGLECVLISTTPQVNGVCQKKNYSYSEDYINRAENSMKNKSLTSDYIE